MPCLCNWQKLPAEKFPAAVYARYCTCARVRKEIDPVTVNNMTREAERIAQLIKSARHAVAFTGAGISTESGIPDFRSPGGIWDMFDCNAFDYKAFICRESARREHWRLFRSLSGRFMPNPAHLALDRLCGAGYLKCIITQNIDSLQQKAGTDESNIYELHGSLQRFTCLDCQSRFTFDLIEPLMNSMEIPVCPQCSGRLKPDVTFFGEPLPARAVEMSANQAKLSDVFIIIGSTLSVYPAAYMPQYALESGARLVIINLTATPLDSYAEITVSRKAGEVMPLVADLVTGSC